MDVADANEAIDVSDDVAEWDRLRRADEKAAEAHAGKLLGM